MLTLWLWHGGFGPQTKQYEELKSKGMMLNFETWPPKSGTIPYDPYNERRIFVGLS